MCDFGNVAGVKVGGFDDGFDMRSKGKGRAMDDARVAYQWGRSNGYVVDGE